MFTFTTREEYLAYKAEWKSRYFGVIKQIRAAALKRRDAERAFSKVEFSANEFWAAYNLMIASRNEHKNLKHDASDLLVERFRSKLMARDQREKRLRELGILI